MALTVYAVSYVDNGSVHVSIKKDINTIVNTFFLRINKNLIVKMN